MRAVIQRVSRAAVRVEGQTIGEIGRGLLVLLGIGRGDTDAASDWLIKKLLALRIFPDEADKMNRSVTDIGGGILVVSQFTLYGDASAGRRPSFIKAAPPELANKLYESFIQAVQKEGLNVQTGIFGAKMEVSLVNDGPVTLIIER